MSLQATHSFATIILKNGKNYNAEACHHPIVLLTVLFVLIIISSFMEAL